MAEAVALALGFRSVSVAWAFRAGAPAKLPMLRIDSLRQEIQKAQQEPTCWAFLVTAHHYLARFKPGGEGRSRYGWRVNCDFLGLDADTTSTLTLKARIMADQAKRGGQKMSTGAGGETKKHQGVRPGSTTQNKAQRQKQAERRPDQKTTVASEERQQNEQA